MSERPSPYKIGVCALIALYSDPNSPLNELLDEIDGPAAATSSSGGDATATTGTKIASFIERSVIGNGSTRGGGNIDTSLSTWLHEIRRTVDDDRRLPQVNDANANADAEFSNSVAYLVLDTLLAASESIDSLVDLMDSLKNAVHHEGLVDADSINGLYLRQVCLGFDELSFQSVTLLWQSFQEEVSKCTLLDNDVGNRDKNYDGSSASNTNKNMGNLIAWDWPPSTEQLHEMIRRDCMDFQHDFNTATSGTTTSVQRRKRLSFEEMELYIRQMIEKEPELPVAYFLRYLNCVRHGERVGAVEALHQYFDHAMVQHTTASTSFAAGYRNPRRGGSGVAGSSPSPVSSDILQFSAILLAMTHSTFGDSDLALMATEEAVRVAQQSKDTACVAFALGWLYEHHNQDQVQRRQLLERCATRASAAGISAATLTANKPGQPHLHHMHQQQQMSQAAQANAVRAQQLRPLVSGAHLTLARHDLLDEVGGGGGGDNEATGRSSDTTATGADSTVGGQSSRSSSAYARAWSNLLEVTSEPSADPGTVDRPTHLTPHPSDTRSSLARQRLVSAAIWDAVGMPALSTWATKSTLSSLPNDLSYDDMVTAIQNISRLALYGTPSTTRAIPPSSNQVSKQDKPSCVYSTAVGTLIGLRKELGMEGNELEETIVQNLVLTLHEWAVNRMEINDASALQKAMNSYIHPGLANYDQFHADIKMQQCLYYCRLHSWDAARAAARKGVEICEKAGFVNHRVRFLIQTSIIHLESNQIQGTAALSPLLDALTLCEERDMHSLHALGISILAQVFLRLCNPKRAIALLDASIPTLLQREHVWFQAEAYRTLAKAHMTVAVNAIKSQQENDGSSNNSNYNKALPVVSEKRYRKALEALKKSELLYESCQDCVRLQENLYLQSQIYNLLSDERQREITAERFLKVSSRKEQQRHHFADDRPNNSSSSSSRNDDGDDKKDNDDVYYNCPILDALNDPIQLEALIHRVIY